jgi:acyl transferase domain-containing protein/thioesterase domain-containing protein
MRNFIQYILSETKSKRLSKRDAVDLIGQFQSKIVGEKPYFLHPLLHQNTSNFFDQRFDSTFTGQEFFLADHIIKGQKVFPGMAFIEMARAAVNVSAGMLEEGQNSIRIKNVVWTSCMAMEDQSVDVHIELFPQSDGEIGYEIYTESENAGEASIVHSQGSAIVSPMIKIQSIDLLALQDQCNQNSLSSNQCYETLRTKGIDYALGHQGIEKVYVGLDQAVAKVSLPSSIAATQEEFVLHPIILDSALQASAIMLISGNVNIEAVPVLPSTLEEIEVLSSCTPTMWVVIRCSNDIKTGDKSRKIDIDLCDEQGNVCVRMKRLEMHENTNFFGKDSLASPSQNHVDSKIQEDFEMMTFKEEWQEQTVSAISAVQMKTIVCFLSSMENQQTIMEEIKKNDMQTQVIFIAQGSTYQKDSPNKYHISRNDQDTYSKVFHSIQGDYGEVDAILYLWALEDSSCIQDYSSIVYILKAIASVKLKAKRLLLTAQFANGLERCYLESWIGFERSLGVILPGTQVSAIYQEASGDNQEVIMRDWLPPIWAELQADKTKSVLYQGGKRHVYQVEATTIKPGDSLLRAGGTYLITGGCGGLGMLFAEYFANKYAVNLILTGRSPIGKEIQDKIAALEELGSQVLYVQADVCDPVLMKAGLSRAKERFGEINGVIHAAGIKGKENIVTKEFKSFQKVLDPKIKGTIVLDEVLKEEAIDFICYFSSSAAILGDFGSCDYSVGNRFQMAYAHFRNQEQQGKAIVINWPLWKDGGMGFDAAESTRMYLKSSGQGFLEATEGAAIFENLLTQNHTQHLVVVGQCSRVHRFLGLVQDQPSMAAPIAPSLSGKGRRPEMKGLSLEQCVEWDLKEHVSKLLNISRDKLDKDENLAEFGFDSISITEFSNLLTNHYGIELSPAVFFGYSTIGKLVQYFLIEQRKAIGEFYEEEMLEKPVQQQAEAAVAVPKGQRDKKLRLTERDTILNTSEPIAIIGMSGRFPQARNIDDMWKILTSGKDVVEEIPEERFSCMDSENTKWKCGWVPGISEFDPRFFEISPREAEIMDPRQRLLLQESWKALEDAGYGMEQIKKSKIGMFVGVEEGDYRLIVKENGSVTSNHNAILAARLAYFLNLSGPNMAINTACSSGLVAVHQASMSLRNQECDTAIAAGVNLILTPEPFVGMRQAGMLSEDGTCYAFDKRANGLVPGEAVAVVVLKKLSKAQADGDSIYAVIQGSGINYDGKTNGITAPSGVSQTNLIKTIYNQYKVNPEDIEYIVTHGTGTKLGDPIEINALYDAFKDYTKKQEYCALTSVKTNFGHTMAASGLVSLISLVQALRYETIPASLHCEQENNYINWRESPFYVNKSKKSWPARNGKIRTGAISAFGMGGTNAHMVLKSYSREPGANMAQLPYYLLAFSAKSQDALKGKIRDMVTVLNNDNLQEQSLSEISYTLLEGRQHFQHRCAIVVQDRENAIYVLKQVEGNERLSNLFQGKVARDFVGQKAITQYAQELLDQSWSLHGDKTKYREALLALADLYCQGYEINWNRLYGDIKPHRISLPTYPFAREHYWAPVAEINPKTSSTDALPDVIHPLVHQNTSDFSEQRFTSLFTGREFFLADHVVNKQRVLPEMAYLEMARVAVQQAIRSGDGVNPGRVHFKNVVWAHHIAVADEPIQVHIGLYQEDNGNIVYEIYREEGTDKIIHSQGSVVHSTDTEVPILDINALQTECSKKCISSRECYEMFSKMGLEYGPGHQGINKIYVGQDQVLAKLLLPSSIAATQEQFVLHPSIMDSAMQASISLMSVAGEMNNKILQAVPLSLQELDIFNRCSSAMWVLVRYSDDGIKGNKVQKFEINLCDEQGNVCVRMKGVSSRILEGEISSAVPSGKIEKLMLEPFWKEQAPHQEAAAANVYVQHLVILCEPGGVSEEIIKTKMKGVRCLRLESNKKNIEERFQIYASQVFEKIQTILKDKPKGKVLIQIVVSIQDELQLFCGLSGLLKTAQLENPKIIGQVIEMELDEDVEKIIEKLKENIQSPIDNRIRYQDSKRWVGGWNKIESPQEETNIPWKDCGVYLITGGAGGLGLIFAKEIVHRTKDITLILTGRSPITEDKRAQFMELEDKGARIIYKQVDVVHKQPVEELIKSIVEEFGRLDGIIHGAGVIKDNFILKKNREELQEVLAPKVTGLVNLDQASKDLALDFFVFFSSIAGAMGNIGQADYSIANSFMDNYARYRNILVAAKQRQGKTLSINWPLWRDGGMHVDGKTEQMMQSMGVVTMQTSTGIGAFYHGLASGQDQVMVIEGNLLKMQENLLRSSSKDYEQEGTAPILEADLGILREKTINQLKILVGEFTKMSVSRIDAEEPLESYGIDSIMITQLNQKLAAIFGEVSKTLLFEYQTLGSLGEYFIVEYPKECMQWVGLINQVSSALKVSSAVLDSNSEIPVLTSFKNEKKSPRVFTAKDLRNEGRDSIAIIGLSGRYPQAKNIKEYWENLKVGRECITEISQERWPLDEFYEQDPQEAVAQGKSYSKWGGFLEGYADFDPLFFNISPREAVSIDPQERLFIESCWEVFEDAGYTKEQLAVKYDGRVGVFAGITKTGFNLFGPELWKRGEKVFPHTSFSSVANRISYLLNLQGPSMPIDTMCSSSLTAIHEACEHLYRGECEMAIAGGVNLYLHPASYIGLCGQQMLSLDGQCRSFGAGSKGFVPGEGVGVVLLKPLSKAIIDGDNIYAVIRGSSINHGGKTNGYTVPNPNAQAQLMENNFKKSGIDPQTISYVEAAANGSELGDAIEFTALNKTFQKFTQNKQFCAIGSVKPNIGHAEAASGIAQLTKVILQLQHKQLVPSINAEPLNPNISFKNTPFYLQREVQDWKRPIVRIDGEERELPLRATISSFGAGGSNSHVIVEEYVPAQKTTNSSNLAAIIQPQIVIFSAKSAERLRVVVERIIDLIGSDREISLADFAYTLQVGREAMESRLAMVVSSQEELLYGLKEYLKSIKEGKKIETSIPIFIGDFGEETSGIKSLLSGKVGETVVQLLLAEKNLEKIALHWSQGGRIPWKVLHEDKEVRRISLPTYPFEKRRCWIEIQPELGMAERHRSLNDASSIAEIACTSVDDRVITIISRLLGLSSTEVNLNVPLSQYGFDSIILMQLLQQLQAQVDSTIDLVKLQDSRTIQEIINTVRSENEDRSSLVRQQKSMSTPKACPQFPELIRLNQRTQGRPVFWFHPAQSGVEVYSAIAQKSQRPFYGIQARGWMTNQSPLHGIQRIASYYAHIIQSVQPEGPYDLGGYSLGGIFAYEVTRQLQELGETVDTVVMLDAFDKAGLKKTNLSQKSKILQAVNMALVSTIQHDPEKVAQTLIHRDIVDLNMDDDEFLKQLIILAEKRGLTKTETQLYTLIQQIEKVQQGYDLENYSVLPLSEPQAATSYYFRNKSGLFLGELEPYLIIENDRILLDHINYWKDWEQQFSKFYMMDADSSNHFMMLSEPKAYETIHAFCEKLYSAKGISTAFRKSFTKKHMGIIGSEYEEVSTKKTTKKKINLDKIKD